MDQLQYFFIPKNRGVILVLKVGDMDACKLRLGQESKLFDKDHNCYGLQ